MSKKKNYISGVPDSGGNHTAPNILWGLVIVILASAMTYYMIVKFHGVARDVESRTLFAVTIAVFWILVLFGIGFIGSITHGVFATVLSHHRNAWAWAGYGILITITALTVGTISAWIGFELAWWDAVHTLAETPLESGILFGTAGSVGYIYTTDRSE